MHGPVLYLCRHGDTAWSSERRLAGRSDIPLVPHGEANARQLGERLARVSFDRVLQSPLQRARRTAELAGLAGAAQIDERLLEMDFGRYEGRTIDEIRAERPGWTYLRHGSPEGETAADLGRRADALIEELRQDRGQVALFAHSVILRVVAARWIGLPPEAAGMFMMAPAALGILAYDAVDETYAVAAWNERQHLHASAPLA